MEPPSLRQLSRIEVAKLYSQEVQVWMYPKCYSYEEPEIKELREVLHNIYERKGTPLFVREELTTSIRHLNKIFWKEAIGWSLDCFGDVPMINCIAFTSLGTINDYKTEVNIINSSEVDLLQKFRIACHYCLEQDIEDIWSKLSRGDKMTIPLKTIGDELLGHWYLCLTNNSYNNLLTPRSDSFIKILEWAYCNNSTALNFIFKKLDPADQDQVLRMIIERYPVTSEVLEFDPFIKDINNLKTQVLRKSFSLTLECFLKWPHQEKIYELTNVFPDISAHRFYKAVELINDRKLTEEWNDFNYKNIILYFWGKTSESVKMEIIKSRRYSGLDRSFFMPGRSRKIKRKIIEHTEPKEERTRSYQTLRILYSPSIFHLIFFSCLLVLNLIKPIIFH